MRHQVDGRKFGRNTSHRKAMFRNMANSVIAMEQIVTTAEKAKEIRRVVDRLITLGKSGSPASRKLAFDRTRQDAVVKKLFGELAKRYEGRPGGYTRVVRLSDRRWGDAAEMAVVELVDRPELDRKRKPKSAAPVLTEGGEAIEGQETKQAAAPMDPFSRFRKMFGGQSSGKSGKSMSGGGKQGRSASRKTAPRASKKSSAGE